MLISIALLIGIITGFIFGFSIGAIKALDWAVKKAVYFMELKGVTLDIDTNEVAYGLWTYKERVDKCYPDLNER